jgi:hypothetical protein
VKIRNWRGKETGVEKIRELGDERKAIKLTVTESRSVSGSRFQSTSHPYEWRSPWSTF